jgi:hypothetical protein
MYALKLPKRCCCGFLKRVTQEEGLYVYNMHNKVEKYFTINIAPVRSRGWSLVFYKRLARSNVVIINVSQIVLT